jgi:hypothetical protein
MDHALETRQSEEKDMSNQNRAASRSRHFAIKAAQAKKAKLAETTIEVAGNVITITPANRRFADAVRTRRDEQDFERAALAKIGIAA